MASAEASIPFFFPPVFPAGQSLPKDQGVELVINRSCLLDHRMVMWQGALVIHPSLPFSLVLQQKMEQEGAGVLSQGRLACPLP